MYEALWGAAFLLVIGKISHSIGDLTYIQTMDTLRLKWWMAGFLNTVGAITAIHTSGIVFGLIGFAFEYWGASVVLHQPKLGLLRIGVGATIIILGRPVWQAIKEIW